MPKSEAAQHTPGPWRVDKHGAGGTAIYGVNGKPGKTIGRVCLIKDGPDALLIAAAPDLLTAAEQALACAQSLDQEMTDAYAALHAAIAKARGRS